MTTTFRIRVYAGIGEDKDGIPIYGPEAHAAVSAIEEHASRQYGGVTIYRHRGAWLSDGDVVGEEGRTFELLAASNVGQEFAEYVRDVLRQKSVVLTVEEIPVFFV